MKALTCILAIAAACGAKEPERKPRTIPISCVCELPADVDMVSGGYL